MPAVALLVLQQGGLMAGLRQVHQEMILKPGKAASLHRTCITRSCSSLTAPAALAAVSRGLGEDAGAGAALHAAEQPGLLRTHTPRRRHLPGTTNRVAPRTLGYVVTIHVSRAGYSTRAKPEGRRELEGQARPLAHKSATLSDRRLIRLNTTITAGVPLTTNRRLTLAGASSACLRWHRCCTSSRS